MKGDAKAGGEAAATAPGGAACGSPRPRPAYDRDRFERELITAALFGLSGRHVGNGWTLDDIGRQAVRVARATLASYEEDRPRG